MTARINLNLLPEQQLYLEHLIKELAYNYAWYQESSYKDREKGLDSQSNSTQRYWKGYREAEDLLKSEFGINNL